MRIRAGYEIAYDCPAETPMLLMLNVRPERLSDLETPDVIKTEPHVPIRQYVDTFGNLCTRLVAPAGRIVFRSDFIARDSGLPEPTGEGAAQIAVDDLPDRVVEYLLPSRYCDMEHLNDLAWAEFGGVEPGWARVQAITEYTNRRITFGYEHARPTKTAFEAHEERCGVCRDYAHLAITLLRCMNIPARYATGYLGDIGVPASGTPMDFSACVQVYLGGEWHTLDPRHNARRIGRLLMAVGRDATDVAIATTFGPATLADFRVITEELPAATPQPAPVHSLAAH
jgi:transglutaminase-like putative cysteine protease